MNEQDELRMLVIGLRHAQSAFREGVEAIISEISRFASAAEGAIGEISINEAFWGVRRVVSDRVAVLTGDAQDLGRHAKPEASPMRDTDSSSGVLALGSSGSPNTAEEVQPMCGDGEAVCPECHAIDRFDEHDDWEYEDREDGAEREGDAMS